MSLERHTPEQVADDFIGFESQRITLTPNGDTPVTFSRAVRSVRIKNFDTSNLLLVKDSVITGLGDTAASYAGVAPVANIPGGGWFPYCTTTIHIMSAGASVIVVEGWY